MSFLITKQQLQRHSNCNRHQQFEENMAVAATASSFVCHGLISIPPLDSPKSYRTQILFLGNSQLLSSKSILRQRNDALFPSIQSGVHGILKRRDSPVVFAAQSNFLKGQLAPARQHGFVFQHLRSGSCWLVIHQNRILELINVFVCSCG